MLKVDQDLTRVLVLQDKVGVRQSGHFDHDANAMIGPASSRLVGAMEHRRADLTKRSVKMRLQFDPETGEFLSV